MGERYLFPSATTLLSRNEEQASAERCTLEDFTSFGGDLVGSSGFLPGISDEKCEQNKEKRSSSVSSAGGWMSDESSKRNRKHKKKKDKKKKKKKHKTNKEEKVFKPNTIWLENTSLSYDQAYRRDKRPDENNVEFGALYKMDIALYRTHPEWTCLGLKRKQDFNLYPIKKKKKKRPDSTRYFGVVDLRPHIESDANEQSFVHDVQSVDFIPIVSTKFSEGDINSMKNMNDNLYVEENKRYSHSLLADPSDVKLWLDFVDHQNMLSVNLTDDEEKKLKSSKAIVEKKMSILEKAMLKNPISAELIIKYAYLAKEVWSSKDVNEKWKQWLFRFPNSSYLWQEYLLFKQTDLLFMNTSSTVEAYRKCFRMLLGIYEGSIKTHKAEEKAEENLLIIFLQMVILLWQAGHMEKCICFLQCMIEFNPFCPNHLKNLERNEKKKVFEEFFHSNEPRFGEKDAVGWKNVGQDNCTPLLLPANMISTKCTILPNFDELLLQCKESQSGMMKAAWPQLECLRAKIEFLPFRGDANDCEDTERIVLFDDISFALFNLPTTDLQFQLVIVYLFLLGVPIIEDMIHPKVLQLIHKCHLVKTNDSSVTCLCHEQLFSRIISIDSLLLGDLNNFDEEAVTNVRFIFSQATICFAEKHLRRLSQIWLHFESMMFYTQFADVGKKLNKKYWKEMNKFFKSVLKLQSNRYCVDLWHMYANYEWNLGNADDSRKIISTTLQLVTVDDDMERILHMSSTIRSLLSLHLNARKCGKTFYVNSDCRNQILNISTAFVEPSTSLNDLNRTPSNVCLLKVSSLLLRCFTMLKDNGDFKLANRRDFLCSYVMFQYFFAGISALVNAFEEIRDIFLDIEPHQDYAHIFIYILLLVKNHLCTEHSHFSWYKKSLQQTMKMFPGNTTINHLFMESQQHGLDSLCARRIYESLLDRSVTCQIWLNALKYEQMRLQLVTPMPSYRGTDEKLQPLLEISGTHSGIHNRIVSIYRRMFSKDTQLKYCAMLWESFIMYQLQHSSLKSAQDTFYVALQFCPGAKSLYLLACEHLGLFDQSYELMMEKELRVKLILEELELLWDN